MNNSIFIQNNYQPSRLISIECREKLLNKVDQQNPKNPQMEQNQQIVQTILIENKKEKNISRDTNFKMEGFLQKKSPHFLQGYQTRFCILQDCKLSYYRLINQDEVEKNPYGVLNFDIQTYDCKEQKNNFGETSEFILTPVGCSKQFIFKADSDYMTNQWAIKVQQQLILSKGKQKQIMHLSKTPKFWRNDVFSFQQVYDQGDDGDILLFRGKGVICKGIQAFTNGVYDHVAIIFKDNGVPMVLEAVQEGVGYFEWQKMKSKNYHNVYEKTIIRKLKVQRTPEMRTKFRKFIIDSLGSPYSINLDKVLMQVSAIRPQNPNQEQEKRTYFCSELVAKALKEMEVLKTQSSSTQFYPSSFEQGNKIFDDIFTQEYYIDFIQ